MIRGVRLDVLAAVLFVAATLPAVPQVGGKPVTGNPTPGIDQPAPPNLADRITVTGCLRPVPGGTTATTPNANTPSDARFMLANAERVGRVPPGTGGSPLAASVSGRSYRLSGIDSQFSPFVGTKVEVSGEIASPASSAESSTSTLIVEFVQKVASTCT